MIAIFNSVIKELPPSVKLENDLHHQFLEQYRFRINSDSILIKIHYKKDYVVSNVTLVDSANILNSDIKANLHKMKNKKFISFSDNSGSEAFDTNDVNYNTISKIISEYRKYGMNISISKVSDYHYKTTVYFRDENCDFNIFFDSLKRITKIIPCRENYNKVIYNRILKIHFK